MKKTYNFANSAEYKY